MRHLANHRTGLIILLEYAQRGFTCGEYLVCPFILGPFKWWYWRMDDYYLAGKGVEGGAEELEGDDGR